MNQNTPTDVPMTEERIQELSRRPAAKLLPDRSEMLRNQICVTCSGPIKAEDFADDVERREYNISGMCPNCQRAVFSDEGMEEW